MHLIGKNVFRVPIGTPSQDAKATRFGLRYCPSMDLVAVFPQVLLSDELIQLSEKDANTQDEQYYGDEDEISVEVYRLNGQKVFTILIESDSDTIWVVDVAWREDGVMLAVVTSDNVMRLVNSFSGKIVHTHKCVTGPQAAQYKPTDRKQSPASKRKSTARDGGMVKRRCMPGLVKYSTHFSETLDTHEQLETAKKDRGVVLDDLLSLNADVEGLLRLKANLPKQLASIDIEQYLPKLATLPANGLGDDDVFSTRTSLDAIFHSSKQDSRLTTTDIVTTSQTDGYIHVRIFDSFEVGDVNVSQATRVPANTQIGRIELIVAHPLSETIYLIVDEARDGHSRTSRSHAKSTNGSYAHHLLKMDLQFLRHSSFSLPTLATKATQLQNLIRYLKQIESQMAREANTAFDLPARFLRNLEEDLKEQDGEGSTFETSAYNTLLTGRVHGKFKEWLADVLGDRGVKRWDKSVSDCLDLFRRLVNENWNPAVERAGVVLSRLAGIAAAEDYFGIQKSVIDGLRETIDVMAVIGEDLLKDVCNEMTGFNAFVKWLKREVEMAGLEDTSEKLDEMREGSDYSEINKVMCYISTNLRDTSVKAYVHSIDTNNEVHLEKGAGFFEAYRQSRQAKRGSSGVTLKRLTDRMAKQCDQLFRQVASKLREGVSVEYVCALGSKLDPQILDARLVWDAQIPILHLVGRVKDEEKKIIHLRKDVDISESIDVPREASVQFAPINCDQILDIRIADDNEILFLVSLHGYSSIIKSSLQDPTRFTTQHTFGSQSDEYTKAGLIPYRLDVNGRKNRRTVTVLDEQGRGYGVFDLDTVEDAKHALSEDESMNID